MAPGVRSATVQAWLRTKHLRQVPRRGRVRRRVPLPARRAVGSLGVAVMVLGGTGPLHSGRGLAFFGAVLISPRSPGTRATGTRSSRAPPRRRCASAAASEPVSLAVRPRPALISGKTAGADHQTSPIPGAGRTACSMCNHCSISCSTTSLGRPYCSVLQLADDAVICMFHEDICMKRWFLQCIDVTCTASPLPARPGVPCVWIACSGAATASHSLHRNLLDAVLFSRSAHHRFCVPLSSLCEGRGSISLTCKGASMSTRSWLCRPTGDWIQENALEHGVSA